MIFKIKMPLLIAIGCFATLFCAARQAAPVHITMPGFFGSNMVLQRNQPIKFWGTATAGTSFTVVFSAIEKKVTVNKSGNWTVIFPALKAGIQVNFKVISDSSFSFTNIIMGDVWLCSGQSNMEYKLNRTDSLANDLQEQPNIRSYTTGNRISNYPQTAVDRSGWQLCDKKNALSYSAVAFYFAQKLYRNTSVPIGIIHTSWGGTKIRAWMSEAAIAEIPEYKKLLNDFIESRYTAASIDSIQQRNNIAVSKNIPIILQHDKGHLLKYPAGNTGEDTWATIDLPGNVQQAGDANFKGIIWLRKEIELTDIPAGKQPCSIKFGRVLTPAEMWVNGSRIGRNSYLPGDNRFNLSANILKAGKNILVIRLDDRKGNAVFNAKKEEMVIRSTITQEVIASIAGTWQMQPTLSLVQLNELLVPLTPDPPNTFVTSIYNTKIHPFTKLPIKGFLWYQGESDADVAAFYKRLFQTMIADWRRQFNQGNLPFLFVQLPNFNTNVGWVEIRESQAAALQLPNTAMAVTIDVGEASDIHPRNKKPVGERLADAALQMVYHQKNIGLSPACTSFKVMPDGVHIKFNNAPAGLMAGKGNTIKGFTIAGDDKKFKDATAKLIGLYEIVVSSADVLKPLAVRYAWLPNPIEANLINRQGLPAAPFRTDVWPLFTEGKIDK